MYVTYSLTYKELGDEQLVSFNDFLEAWGLDDNKHMSNKEKNKCLHSM